MEHLRHGRHRVSTPLARCVEVRCQLAETPDVAGLRALNWAGLSAPRRRLTARWPACAATIHAVGCAGQARAGVQCTVDVAVGNPKPIRPRKITVLNRVMRLALPGVAEVGGGIKAHGSRPRRRVMILCAALRQRGSADFARQSEACMLWLRGGSAAAVETLHPRLQIGESVRSAHGC